MSPRPEDANPPGARFESSMESNKPLAAKPASLSLPIMQPANAASSTRSGASGLLASGTTLAGRFRVACLLGSGGMGEVYEAEDAELQQRVAIKIIKPEIANDTQALARFRREISLARRITHPNVCRIYDVFHHTLFRSTSERSQELPEKIIFLSMELLVGETLAQYIRRRGKLETTEAFPIISQLALGLSAAHSAGVIHRDFKPGNVQLVQDGLAMRAVITDFGLASDVIAGTKSESRLTDIGVMLGTPLYMAPEQVEGKATSIATDIYAFGVLVYEMVTGTCPFVGDNPMEIAVKRLTSPPIRPSQHVPNLDPVWEAAIMRCLQLSPSARFSNTEQVVRALSGEVPDRHLGSYELLSRAVNEGGPIEAWDVKNCRVVAIQKLAPCTQELLTSFKERVSTVSQLTHANICAVYELCRAGDTDFLVFEYLEGETLDKRLSSNAIDLSEALAYGIEIAEALSVAHEKGLIHGQLTPRNVFITRSGCKINFVVPPRFPLTPDHLHAHNVTPVGFRGWPESPTPSFAMPEQALEDLRYVSPEQLQEKPLDCRTDIYSFGALFFEIVTGKKAFQGESPGSIIAEILSPETASRITSRSNLPYSVIRVIRKCLSKVSKHRFQSAKELKLELESIAARGTNFAISVPHFRQSRGRRRILTLLLSGFVAIASLVAVGLLILRSEVPYDVSNINPPPRTFFALEEEDTLGPAVTSNDGKVAFAAERNGRSLLYLRAKNGVEKELTGTDRATFPFWSPDSKWVAFFSDKTLKKVNIDSGRVISLCPATTAGRGGTWNKRGIILFGQTNGGIRRYSDDQPLPIEVTRVDTSNDERSHRWPYFMPDGDHFLFLATYVPPGQDAEAHTGRIYIGSLSSRKPAKRLNFESESNVAFVTPPSPLSFLPSMVGTGHGYLFYAEKGFLMARPYRYSFAGKILDYFLPTREPVKLQDNITYFGSIWFALFSVSENNLVYQTEPTLGSKLVLYDGQGKSKAIVEDDINATHVRFSPNGEELAAEVYDEQRRQREIWIYARMNGVFKKRTVLRDYDGLHSPIWSRDSKSIAFGMNSKRTHVKDLYMRAGDGSGASKLLLQNNVSKVPTDWSSKNQIAYNIDSDNGRPQTIGIYDVQRGRIKTENLEEDGFHTHAYAAFSPDGKLIAFQSQSMPEGYDVVLRAVEGSTEESPVSRDGGYNVRWCNQAGPAGGMQLFYITPERKLMAVMVEPDGGLKKARPLFATSIRSLVKGGYDVSPDCREIVISTRPSRTSAPLTRILNWYSKAEFH